MPCLVRINKLLSKLAVASRRRADDLIKRGQVFLNGGVVMTPGILVDIERDKLVVCGRNINIGERKRHLYYIVNKPRGYISTVVDTHNRKKVVELIPKNQGLFCVGRLDKDTRGLILLTNDGELTYSLHIRDTG
jgi:16S rRNA U516 pseudouridylate synthase RsuA-like enzyme